MGSIQKRGKNSWRLQVTVGTDAKGHAVKKHKTIKAKNGTEAKAELTKFEAEILTGQYVDPERMSVEQFYREEWSVKYAPDHYGSKATLSENIKIIEKRILPVFGRKKMFEVKTIHIINYVNDLKKDGQRLDGKAGLLSASSIRNIYKALNSLFKAAKEYGLIKDNPAEGIKLPSVGSSKVQLDYSTERIWEMIEAIGKESLDKQVIFWVALVTSAREAEIAALEEKHIYLDKHAIRFDQSLAEVEGGGVEVKSTKNHLEGTAAIPPELTAMIEKLLHDKRKRKMRMRDKWEYPDTIFLFSNVFGRPIRPDSISQWWIRFIKKNELQKIRFHDLRHISITFLIGENMSMKAISSRARHSKIGTTMDIYGHNIVEVDREAADHFSQFFHRKKG